MSLFRTKNLDDMIAHSKKPGGLAKVLGPFDLVLMGIGAIVGTGIFVLTGTGALTAGPALSLSFVVAAVACCFAALCYAEFASTVPVAGSIYTYSYATLGELAAWMIGWDLLLEYGLAAAAVSVGWSGYFQSLLSGFGIALPVALTAAPGALPGVTTFINLPALVIMLLLTAMLGWGVRESARLNNIMVAIKVGVVLLFIIFGARHVQPANWQPYMPFGYHGMLSAAALGSTLLTLGERAETASTAANAIVQKFAAATKGTKKFKAAMGELGLTTEEVQKGMSTDAMATMDKIIAAIGKLPSDQRIGVMVGLVGLEHSDTLAKLVDKPEELARQRELANGAGAKGSMAREAAARNAALSAQWQMTKNRAFNLGATIGETLAPALLKLLNIVNPMLESFTKWVQEHPTLVKWVLATVVGLSALLAVLGMLLVPLAILAGKAMLLRFVFARLALGSGLGARAFGLVRMAVMGAGRAVLWLGRALLATPLGRAFALLATSATMVYNNWEGIKGGLVAIWDGVVGRVKEALSGGIKEWIALLVDFSPIGIIHSVIAFGLDALGIEIPARFSTLGGNMITGLVNGLTAGMGWLKDTVVGMAASVGGWFAEKLGIASPSRVFMQYGGWVSEGAALGIAGGQGAVRTAALGMATAATMAMPMAADAAALSLDTRAPLAATAPGAGLAGAGATTINITINAAPGMDPKELARAVTAELERQKRTDRTRVLSSMSDID